MNRKNILLMLLMLLLVTCLVFTACGNKKATNETSGGQTDAIVSPNEPNVAVYANLYSPIDDWDPSSNFDQGIAVLLNLYDTLLRYNPDTDSVENVLCTAYEVSEDGLTWTFHLREDAVFHDGNPVNAEAAKYSFERTLEKGLGAAFIWDPVESFEVIEDYTLVMHLKYTAAMDLVCCSPYAAFIMSPTTMEAHDEAWITEGNEAGSGPYSLESNINGEQVVMARFDDYWGGWKEGQFDKAVIQKVAETSTRRLMLENGEADFVSQLTAEDIEALQDSPNITVSTKDSYELFYLVMNCAYGPCSDVNVRKTLAYAFPYEDAIEYAAGGYGSKAYGSIPTTMWGAVSEDEIDSYDYDLEEARECLATSAYPDGGFTILVTYPTGDETQRKALELYQSELNKLNITLDIQAMTSDMYIVKAQSSDEAERQDMATNWWWPDVPGPYTYLYSIYHQSDPVSWNWTYYKNDEFDALIDEANVVAGVDREQAIGMYKEAQQMLFEDVPAITCFSNTYVDTYASTIGGYVDNIAYPRVIFFYNCYRNAK